ncbi:hypothetical protein [Haliscomenobacter sp.]|uniref:hypothetical protein n=1 Tax=Haliscomenobacter sp. TaxID=2717303 RepID=UPI0035947FD6
MSAMQSNLSLSDYAYDMVVSVTQDAINTTLLQYLSKYEGQEFISCYVYNPDYDPNNPGDIPENIPGDYDALVALAGMDLFSIPNSAQQTPAQKTAATTVYGEGGFSFAFKASMGTPEGFSLFSLPDVVVFDKGTVMVTYNLYFKNFQILNTEENRGVLTWTNMSQADQPAPWVFSFIVNLDLNTDDSTAAFNSLPASVQSQVKNLNPDSMFSVQQLYLDLNNAGLESAPTVVGLPSTSTAYIYLTEVFTNSYFKQVQAQGGDLLGYTVVPQSPNTSSPSLIPTDLSFIISPLYDENGKPVDETYDYTLNYLVMSNNNHLPAPKVFTWNWVETAETSDFNGTSVVRKADFVSFINHCFSAELYKICLIPTVDFDAGWLNAKYHYGYYSDTSAHNFTTVNDGTNHVLSFSYSRSASAGDRHGLTWGSLTIRTDASSNVYFENNTIRNVTSVDAWIDYDFEGGHTTGYAANYTITTIYVLAVDTHGKLVVTINPNPPTMVNNGTTLDADTWSEISTLGQVNDNVSDFDDYFSSLQDYLSGYSNDILNMLNGSNVWVYPGGQTFSFKDIKFSDYLDLVAHVTYVDPT